MKAMDASPSRRLISPLFLDIIDFSFSVSRKIMEAAKTVTQEKTLSGFGTGKIFGLINSILLSRCPANSGLKSFNT
jgi:hypothetical protein